MPMPKEELTILIVDEQLSMRRIIKEMLRRMGYKKFLEADDDEVALDYLRSQRVGLILCEWRMIHMAGVEVLRFVRQEEPLHNLPFIMLTTEANKDLVSLAGELDVDAYLLKPFTIVQLEDKIKAALARRLTQSSIDVHLQWGLAYLLANQINEAEASFQQAVAIDPKSPGTMLALGQAYQGQGDDQRALTYMQKALELAPKFVKAHEALARLFHKLKRPEKALRHLKEATAISPQNLERHFQLAQLLVASGQPQEAKKALNTVMKLGRGQYANMYRRVGEAMMNAGLIGEAEEAFKQALDVTSQDIHIFNRLGMAFRKQGKFQDAVANYERALGISPENEGLLYNLARAHLDAGDIAAAKRALSRAIRLNPDFKEARDLFNQLPN